MERRSRRGHQGRLLLFVPVILGICLLLFAAEWMAGEKSQERISPAKQEAGKKSGKTESGEESQPEVSEKPVLYINTEESESLEGEAVSGKDKISNQTELLFAGDIYLSDHVLGAWQRGGGITGVLDDGFRQEIEESDIFMANQEFPFSNGGTPESDKQFTFCLPEDKVSILQAIGPDIVALANNHALDYGQEALSDTCRVLDEAGILHVGAGENLDEAKKLEVIEAGGRKFGFLAASRVFPKGSWAAGENYGGMLTAYDSTVLLQEIKKSKEVCDFLTVYLHWGIERNTEPEGYQRTLGQQYIDAGADLVIGSHPHVLQGIEYYKGKPIVYSLGNFVFGSSIPKTMLLSVTVPMEGEPSLVLIPGTSSGGYTRLLTEEAEKQNFYRYMEGISFGIKIDERGRVERAQ